MDHTAYTDEARERGRQAALTAASWTVDGNTEPGAAARVLEMLEDGDPQAWDYLPRTPNLSGEWGDDPTPLTLAREITGMGPQYVVEGETQPREDDPDAELIDAIADAFEEGASEVFEDACATELRRAAGDDEA